MTETKSDVYRELQEHLDTFVIGFPATKSGVELRVLKYLFTPEEASIATYLSFSFEDVETIYERIKNSGASLDDLKKVLETIKKYNLLNKKDKILVAASGGKDSTTVLYLLKKFGFKVEALFIDLGIGKFSKINKENIKKFCKNENIKLNIISFKKFFGH